MPLPGFGIPGITQTGAGSSVPISAGGGTSGPATSGFTGAPINIGGLFGSGASGTSNLLPLIALAGIAITLGITLLRK